jgi:dehydro coenzyme F420 reductase / coenzyme F420-0:L-glutamate ligase / coenzyme F420-1:gamma-L-glutamate ligase
VEISVIAVSVAGEVEPGADLPRLIDASVRSAGVRLQDGDVVVVTQKVVSKAERRIVPEGPNGRASWVAAEARRIVARRGDLVIAETRHGFVCANAGVDASNVAEGFLTLLPEDPDASAEGIRLAFRAGMDVDVGVIITDTFGRPWRQGLVNVAIGCAGLPAVVDLRGTKDASGRVLEATVEALADEIAAATGLVMGKAEGVPIAVVRGVHAPGPPLKASALVRRGAEDLFRESPLQAIHARRSIRRFGRGEVPGESLREAVAAACTAPAPHHTRPWLFVALRPGPLRRRLLAAMRQAWAADLRGDGTDPAVIERRLRTSDQLLGEAPVIIVPFVRLRGSHAYPDEDRAAAEREMFLLSGGAAIQSLMLALHAQGLASCWVSSTLFCKEETRDALGLAAEWIPLGSVAVGPPPDGEPPPRPSVDVGEFLRDGS